MTAYPNATWGGRVKVEATERMYVMGGLYNGDVSIRADEHHGADWSMDGPLFAIGEVDTAARGLGRHDGDLGIMAIVFATAGTGANGTPVLDRAAAVTGLAAANLYIVAFAMS